MRKNIINFFIVLCVLLIAPSYAAVDVQIGTPKWDAKKNITTLDSYDYPKDDEAQPISEEEKKGFFSKFFNKNNYKKQKPASSTKKEKDKQGYYGTLPTISGGFKNKKNKDDDEYYDEEDGEIYNDIDPDNLKPARFDDTLFLDNIIKKEKTSNYINDLHRAKFALQSLKKCIEEKGDIQRFNGCVNVIDLYCKNLQKKYENKSDSLRESYVDIMLTNYEAKVLGNLLYDSNYYAKYIPTQQGKYSKENIDKQKRALLNRINKTLFIINNET